MKLVFPGGEHPQVLLGNGINRIGSDPGGHIVLKHPGILAQHCQLRVSSHGVMLDVPAGAAVSVNNRTVDGLISLRVGDMLCFDDVKARLTPIAGPGPATREPGATPAPAVEPCDDPGATAIRPVLPKYILRGVGEAYGHNFSVPGAATIGRAPECALRVDEPGLSRAHARLIPTDEGLQIEDLGSTNGSFVNGHRVVRGLAQVGDEVGFDTLRFRLIGPRPTEHAGASPAPPRPSLLRSRLLWLNVGAVLLAVLIALGFALLR